MELCHFKELFEFDGNLLYTTPSHTTPYIVWFRKNHFWGALCDVWNSLVFPLKFNIELRSEETDMKLLFGDLEIESRYIETLLK